MFLIQWVSPAPCIDGVRAGSDFGPHWSSPLSMALRNSLLWTVTFLHHELYWMQVLGFWPKTTNLYKCMKNKKEIKRYILMWQLVTLCLCWNIQSTCDEFFGLFRLVADWISIITMRWPGLSGSMGGRGARSNRWLGVKIFPCLHQSTSLPVHRWHIV